MPRIKKTVTEVDQKIIVENNVNQERRPPIIKSKEKVTFKSWILDLLHDERGSVSIKPVVALMGSLFLCGALLASALSPKPLAFSDVLVNAVMVITCIGLGGDTFDKFSYKKTDVSYQQSPLPPGPRPDEPPLN